MSFWKSWAETGENQAQMTDPIIAMIGVGHAALGVGSCIRHLNIASGTGLQTKGLNGQKVVKKL